MSAIMFIHLVFVCLKLHHFDPKDKEKARKMRATSEEKQLLLTMKILFILTGLETREVLA